MLNWGKYCNCLLITRFAQEEGAATTIRGPINAVRCGMEIVGLNGTMAG